VQLPLKRNGAPDVDGHAVHADASMGVVHWLHAWSQGWQKPVAFGEKPAGHAVRHWPRCMRGVAPRVLHERQLAASGPSHVAQDASHEPHVLADVTNKPTPHAEACS